MSQACFPDPARSRALLIGASHFTAAGPDLPDIPAVEANLTALRQALTNPDTGVLRPDLCRVLADPGGVDEVGTALSELAATATDLLLVYYAGHGLVDDRGRLHLALAHTHPHRARWTAFPLELLREEIANSAAAARVLVLDCCFSGRAIEVMADDQGVLSGQLEVAGTYTLTSTTANAPSHAPVGDRYTAFTGALLRALDHTDPLTLDQIHAVIDRDLTARNLPRPQRRAVNTAGNLALSRGPTTQPHTERTDLEAVRFTSTVTYSLSLALIPLLLIVAFPLLGSLLSFLTIIQSITGGLILVLLSVAVFCISKRRDARVGEFIVDRSGFTIILRNRARTHLAWRDIAQVGVLQPQRGALNRRLAVIPDTWPHVLVVRLRPEVPAPSVVSVLSDEHRLLGYLGLCTVEELWSSRQEMISALERFAGGKLVHSSRQFLDRDPRLRPEMV